MKCVKCGTDLSETALVCHACGHLLPRPDDLQMAPATERPRTTLLSDLDPDEAADMHSPVPGDKEVHAFAADRRWLDYYLPGIFLAAGLITYLSILWLLFGAQGIAFVALDIAVALFIELPLAITVVAIAGTLFHINFGLVGPGILKLAALNIAFRGLVLTVSFVPILGLFWPAGLIALLGVAFLLWFLMTVFELTFSEMIALIVVNIVFSSLLYAGVRLLFSLPHYVVVG